MCPKAKSDRVVTHRIEFQDTERDALEMVAASITARNVTAGVENITRGVGNLITPILSASAAGVAAALGLLAWWELQDIDNEKNNPTYDAAMGSEPGWIGKILAPLQGPQRPDEWYGDSGYTGRTDPPTEQEQQATRRQQKQSFRAKVNQLQVAISTQLMKLGNRI